MAVYLARNCPHCGNYWGISIAKPDGTGSRSIHGRCAKCGYEIAWAIISSKYSTHIKPLTRIEGS